MGNIGLVILVIRLHGRGPLHLPHGHLLDRLGTSSVRVTLSQDRVYCTTQHFSVASLDLLLLVSDRVGVEVWYLEPLALQLSYGGHQLWDRGRNVGQLDDVAFRGLSQIS